MRNSMFVVLFVMILVSYAGAQDVPDVTAQLAKADSLAAEFKYDRAIAVCQEILAAAESAFGRGDTILVPILNRIGLWHELGLGDLPTAESCWQRALRIRETVFGPDHLNVARSLNNLAILNWQMGRYRESQSMYERSLAITAKVTEVDESLRASLLANMGMVYHTDGNYARAEQLYTEALEIRERILDPGHLDIARVVNNLAVLFDYQRKYAKAEAYYQRALSIKKSNLGDNHPETATSLLNLATLYVKQGDYDRAESLLREALAIFEQSLGEEHVNTASAYLDLADIYKVQEKYPEAESLTAKARQIIEKAKGPEHPDVASALTTLGDLCVLEGDLTRADTYFTQALRIRQAGLAVNHPHAAATMQQLAQLRYRQQRVLESMDFARQACFQRHSHFAQNAIVLTERDALKYSRSTRDAADLFFTMFFESPPHDDADVNDALAIALATKGFVSDAIFERRQSIINEPDSALQALAEDFRLNTFYLSRLFVSGPDENLDEYREQVDSLRGTVHGLEEELAIRSASFRHRLETREINPERILPLLPMECALVEYVKYNHVDVEGDTSQPCYLASVIGADTSLAVIDLGDASAPDSLIRKYRSHMLRISSQGARVAPADAAEYREISRRIWERIWKPIVPYLEGKKLVFIAPDGFLNFLSFAGLIDPDGRYLIEEKSIHYLSAGRDLTRYKELPPIAPDLFAMGDPNYDAEISQRTSPVHPGVSRGPELAPYVARGTLSDCAEFADLIVAPLPSSRDEIQSIAARWREYCDDSIIICMGDMASEDLFKAYAPGNRLLHLATHGYYLETPCGFRGGGQETADDISHDPLFLSGLFFAGANLHGRGADSTGVEDGILTAYEVASLNLTGTMMVVLSACETALGEIETGEGVYGLRRAFQTAGVRTVICALWPISDQMASAYFDGLYRRDDRSLPDLMRDVQLAEIARLRQQNKPDHPFSWGPFIALGGWRHCPGKIVARAYSREED